MAATTDHVPPVIVAPELDAGARLGERYRLIARLGRGGGGAVWHAFDEKVGEDLALKLIDGNTDLERWRREVALARRISHPNVCRVYDLGEAGELRWVTMEWIEGQSLRALLARGATGDRERLMRQLVDAVAAIHAAGVVHRDLKPENVVVDRAGRAVVVDFGLARQPLTPEPPGGAAAAAPHDTVTDHGTILGTPRYMAPEQAAGEPADARSDVYALGLVLREIATGGADDAATAITVPGTVSGDVPAAARPAISLARPWGSIIERCTARAPADRFTDGVAVRAALAPRRGRRLAIAGAVIALAGAGLAFAGQRAAPRSEPSRPIVQRRLTVTTIPSEQPSSLALSHDGTTLAYAVNLELDRGTIDGGRAMPVEMPTTPAGLPLARFVAAAGFLPDGRVIAQILDGNHAWGLWSVGAGTPRLVHARDGRMAVAVSPRGDLLAITTARAGLVVVPLAGGAARPLVAARAGERLIGPAWSPDGARIAFVRLVPGGAATLEIAALASPGTSRVVARERLPDPVDQMTVWPTAGRILYVVNQRDGVAIMAAAPAGDTAPVALVRWPGEYVAQIAHAGGRIAVLRGTAGAVISVGNLDRRGYYLNLLPGLPEQARAGQLAGWTADHRIVHAVGDDVVVRVVRDAATVLASNAIPDAIVDDVVIYHRTTPRGLAIGRVTLDGRTDQTLLAAAGARGATTDGADAIAADVVRCAGDRTAPCVLQLVDDAGARYLRFDPATGAVGGELHRVPGPRFVHAMAVSPDGATLAVADGSRTVTLVSLAGGPLGREQLAPSAGVVGLAWSLDGASLLASVLDGGDDRASVIRIFPGGTHQLVLHSNHLRYGRIYEVALEDGGVALQTRELALDAWLVEGL